MFTSIVQTSTLVLSVYIGAFFVPLLYTTYRKAIDPVVKQAFDQAKVKFDAMHRHPKAAGIALVILLLGYRMSKVDLAIAAFVVCVYARSQLPTEVRPGVPREYHGSHALNPSPFPDELSDSSVPVTRLRSWVRGSPR